MANGTSIACVIMHRLLLNTQKIGQQCRSILYRWWAFNSAVCKYLDICFVLRYSSNVNVNTQLFNITASVTCQRQCTKQKRQNNILLFE